ncbi:protein-glutamate O-methyltransferase CheR [Roseomonas sp. KE2513]|uniref:CheR family methyltransferase n=1 Tax=Roseomonas sp. KE2513 TaxID=2479202 RepID=UPI0018DF8C22|nr:protein-glutamate O-methyltransferase CheR [Roseomonas sp. KE2513]MBI0536811.1 protein-glutamate O-methyltransferase CheR [Roseomonas sp. KE2513]
MSGAAFETIAGLVRTRAGIVLGADKAYMLDTRLGGLMREHGLESLDAVAAKLRAPASERLAAAVTEALTTNESFFFRDGKPFDHLRRILPKLAVARSGGQRLRVLSAACSTGQEAYSIAMVVEGLGLAGRVEVLGTDLSTDVVRRAREGLYSQFEVQRGLPVQMLVKHFRQEGAQWRVSPAIRALARFETGNLLADLRSLGTFDVIFCRNVLIYFDAPTKTRVLSALAGRLAPDGVLYLGGAETVLGLTDRFATVEGERGVYAPVVRNLLAG